MMMGLDGEPQQIPLNSASFDSYQSKLQLAALTATKRAFILPQDIQFHRTLDKSFGAEIDAVSARVLSLTDKLLRYAQGSSAKGKDKAILRTEDDLVEGYHLSVIDTTDQLYENADKVLDQLSGRSQPAIPLHGPSTSKPLKPKKAPALDPSLLHAVNLPKPQLKFTRPVDNFSPWYPVIKKRQPSSAVGLSASRRHFELGLDDPRNAHPYLFETLHIQYPPRLFELGEPNQPRSYEETPFTWIDSPNQLPPLLEKLRSSNEIAVDLEYHSLRSYYGFVCLMQISTREEDFIVDTLALREELEVLNEVFTDPSIVKVLHGADSDIVWLQQDFNLYIVNLFDTYQASLLLGGFPKHGLASLLSYFCGFEADKRYQLADWRIRPLPREMLYYARSDTHFLLFVFDNLRNLLLNRSDGVESVQKVLDASSTTSLQVYNREMYDAEEGSGANGWGTFLTKFGNQRTVGTEPDRRRSLIVAIHSWRDRIARELDESPPYVLPSNMIFRLANAPSPPMDLPSLFKIAPLTTIRDRAQELLDVLMTARLPVALVITSLSVPKPPSLENPTQPSYTPNTNNPSAGSPPASLVLDLWSARRSAASSALTRTSAVFGPLGGGHLNFGTAPSSAIAASSSSLFGTSNSSPGTVVTSQNAYAHIKYNDIIRRIHSNLVVAPTIASLPTAPEPPSVTPLPPDQQSNVLVMPAEVPFVPAWQRTTLTPSTAAVSTQSDPVFGDTAVTGRKKGKKRSKKLPQPSQKETSANQLASEFLQDDDHQAKRTPDADSREEGEIETFDFSSIPNVLDNDDETNNGTTTAASTEKLTKKQKTRDKAKRSKGPAASPYGNFPAPPRNRAEPRSGNVSRTFK